MSKAVRLTIETKELRELAQRAGSRGPRAMADATNAFGSRMLRTVANRLPSTQRSLRRSLQATPATTEDIATTIGSSLPWARITHHGGTIRPTDSPTADQVRRRVFGNRTPKYLTIPLKGPGGPKKWERARDFSDLFPFVSKKGNRFLARNKGKGKNQKLQLMFLLLPSVTIKPHPYMYFDRQDQATYQRELVYALKSVISPQG